MSTQVNKKVRVANLWPLLIVALLGVGIVLTVWTLKMASKNPTYMDSAYINDYKSVDKNINEYIEQQNFFDDNYIVDVENTHLKLGDNKISIKIINKDIQPVTNAKVTALITRPHTTATDIKISTKHTQEGEYVSEVFKIDNAGRWEVIYEIELGNIKAHKKVKLKSVGM